MTEITNHERQRVIPDALAANGPCVIGATGGSGTRVKVKRRGRA